MTIDWVVRRSFSGLVLALVALIAYFHATVAMQFVAMALLERAFPAATPTAPRAALASTGRDPSPAAAVLARNPFDSVTGPLVPTAAVSLEEAKKPHGLEDPLAVPLCAGIAASIMTESRDRAWSLASLQASGEPSPRMRRIGDAVGDKQVTYIGYNPRENSPAVWLSKGDDVCQVVLFHSQPLPTPAVEPVTKPASGQVPQEIASKIRKISDHEFQIERQAVDRILEDQSLLMKGVRFVPERQDGRAVGIRLFGIRADSLLGMLGLRSGDRLDSINGYNVADPEKALEAYARLRVAPNLSLVVNRGGAATSIDYKIQ